MKQRPHQHPCQACGEKTDCTGEIVPNPDGWPRYICRAFHLDGGGLNPEFLCDACAGRGGDGEGEDDV